MPWHPYPALPRETVRDLLGIVRALYRVTVATDPKDVVRLQALTDIGREFRDALRNSRSSHPGTVQHSDAWAAAERATRALGEFVASDETQPLAPLVRAAAGRVRRDPL